MTDQERNQVLKMIEDGKITPEQGLHLMQALDLSPVDSPPVEPAAEQGPQDQAPRSQDSQPQVDQTVPDPRMENIKATVRRLWQIPLWIGIVITVLSAAGMYAIMRGPGMNFWFYFMILPLLIGVAVLALAVGSRQARWIFVDVRQPPGEHPGRIFFGFPIPLELIAGILRVFGRWIPDMTRTDIDQTIQVLKSGFDGKQPMIVHVDEGQGGDRVRLYIG